MRIKHGYDVGTHSFNDYEKRNLRRIFFVVFFIRASKGFHLGFFKHFVTACIISNAIDKMGK